ncbi:protein of unknown function DUF1028 [Sphingobium chlorophenolicum L-1]|uniref:Major pilin protein fimA n=1 Tax=Sphingobium chlorophenolicum L-1 TaxID=690566 RepID=F6ETP2_SPHCR|nr:DUF1028 domain-containing protein [Sphingobium chlorophenolicum]AEG49537.1 protein of unknown function DUF1028 [Sphingobium chlorophenolicum L-1]
MTFSIIGRCNRTGMFGVAISSSSPAVAARCAYARAGAGAVATQNITDPRLGPAGLELLREGERANEALRRLMTAAGDALEYRQLLVLDAAGGAAAHSGSHSLGTHAHHVGQDVAAAGNMLATADLPRLMVEEFYSSPAAHLGERLMGALEAALAAGGEAGPVHSAGLLVVDREEWPLTDLRVDWDDAPVAKLRELWTLWEPQMADYVIRALDPTAAPSYGVPGDP